MGKEYTDKDVEEMQAMTLHDFHQRHFKNGRPVVRVNAFSTLSGKYFLMGPGGVVDIPDHGRLLDEAELHKLLEELRVRTFWQDGERRELTYLEQCSLCGAYTSLVGSHIVPNFAFRWLRKQSLTGRFRMTENPNQPEQRGLIKPLLCQHCDNVRFGEELEDKFASQVFQPLVQNRMPVPIPYGDWMLRFCVSVLWRVLVVGIEEAKVKSKATGAPTMDLIHQWEITSERWRSYLLSKQVSYEGEPIYFVPLGFPGLTPEDIGPKTHIWLEYSVAMGTQLGIDAFPMIFAKMGPGMIVCSPQPYWNQAWQKGGFMPITDAPGVIPIGPFTPPFAFMQAISEHAQRCYTAGRRMSASQKDFIEKLMQTRLGDFLASGLSVQMALDVLDPGPGVLGE